MTSPAGLKYLENWLSGAEAQALLEKIASFSPENWGEILFRGVIAKRRAIYFGYDYTTTSRKIRKVTPIPGWLRPIAERAAVSAALEPGALEAAIIWRYPEGSGIGWHLDAPAFGGTVVSISLAAESRMQFRRDDDRCELRLAPNSAVILQDDARYHWQHRITPVKTTRYSITLRNL